MKECPPDPVKMAREVLDHLARHPMAEDTLEGIMQHLLPERPEGRQVTMVREALGDLVTQGLLERTTKDGRTVYRLKHP